MPIKVKLQRQTLPQAEKSDSSHLYVLNKSNPRGNVNFVVTDSGQQKISVQVPVTFIPMDLTTFASKEDVLRSPYFRRLLARGFLHIISEDSAEEFLQDPRAEKEHNRIFEVLQEDNDLEFQAPLSESVQAAPPKSETEVSQFVQNILLRTSEENMADLINELEAKLDTMTVPEVKYIMDNTSSAELKTWCAEAMEVLEEK